MDNSKGRKTIDTLTTKQRIDLALLYDSDGYKALRAFIEAERFNIATKLLDIPADDAVEVSRHQGRANALKMLHLELKRNYEAQVKDNEQKSVKR